MSNEYAEHWAEHEREQLNEALREWVLGRFPDCIPEPIMERRLVQAEFLAANNLPLDTIF